MSTRKQHRRTFAPIRAVSIGVVCIIMVFLFPVCFADAQGLMDNKASDRSAAVLINIYEEYGRNGFLEYELTLPDGVIRETNKGKNGVFINEPEKLAMMSSDTFSDLYKKKLNKKSTQVVFPDLNADKEPIFDTALSPNGLYVAVLTVTWRYSYNPFSLLFTISGHPVGYRTYYLRIYTLDGKLAYKSRDTDIGTFNAGRGSGWGAVVWINKNNTSTTSASKDELNKP